MLSYENKIKFATHICLLSGLYFAIKSDIRELATEKKYEVEHLQYQITELKWCCENGKKSRIVFNEPKAIMPNQVEIKYED